MKERTPEEIEQQKLDEEKNETGMSPAETVPESENKTFAVYSRIEIIAKDLKEATEVLRAGKDEPQQYDQITSALMSQAIAREIDPQDDGVVRIKLTSDQESQFIKTGEITLIGVVVEGISRQVQITFSNTPEKEGE